MAKEARLEKDLREYAETMGVLYIKMHGRGLPDRHLIGTKGRCAYIELKAPNGRPGPLQERKMSDLQQRGFRATFVNNRADGMEIIDSLMAD